MATTLNINGKDVSVQAAPDTPLLWVLRDELQLTGTKYGCGIAQCGACTVHADGQAIRSCQTPIGSLAGVKITTIEGLGGAHPVQAAWVKHDVPQCGYCQSGQIMSAAALLAAQAPADRRRHRRGDERQHLPLRHLPAHPRGDQGRRRRDLGVTEHTAMNAPVREITPQPPGRSSSAPSPAAAPAGRLLAQATC